MGLIDKTEVIMNKKGQLRVMESLVTQRKI